MFLSLARLRNGRLSELEAESFLNSLIGVSPTTVIDGAGEWMADLVLAGDGVTGLSLMLRLL